MMAILKSRAPIHFLYQHEHDNEQKCIADMLKILKTLID